MEKKVKKEKKGNGEMESAISGKKGFFKKRMDLLVPFIVVLLCGALAFWGVFEGMEFRVYDMELRAGRSVDKSDEILLIDIDDISIDDVGVWPWSRDIVADILIRMKEFGASDIVFDIEYLQKSARALVSNADSLVDESIESARQTLGSLMGQFADAASSGMYSAAELAEISGQMGDYVEASLGGIREAASSISRDNDEYLARALQFFGNSWMTVNAGMSYDLDTPESLPESEMNDEYFQFINARDWAASHFLLTDFDDPDGFTEQGNAASMKEQESYRGFYPARYTFLRSAKGAGATNVIVDSDGSRRRIELFHHLDPAKKFFWSKEGNVWQPREADKDYYICQLALRPLLAYLGVESVERKKSSCILHGAKLPSQDKKVDIRIPLDSKGRMLINWSHDLYEKSFKEHVSAAFVYELDRAEERIYQNLSNVTRIRISDEEGWDLPYYTAACEILEEYRQIGEMKSALLLKCQGYDDSGLAIGGGISDEEYGDYFALRQDFYGKIGQYVEAGFKDDVLGRLAALDDGSNSDDIALYSDGMASAFDGLETDYNTFMGYYEGLVGKFKDSFCFIGNTATSSTDLGVTPFERRYPNLGTHANVMNTILQRDFITPLPVWVGLAFAFLCAMLVSIYDRNKSNGRKNIYGLFYIIIPLAVMLALMYLFRIYIPLFVPALFLLITYITQAVINFIAVSRDRNTLRRGFDAYVSPEVVSQIVKDPSHLSLGGANKNITALFSDVKSFSAFTEMVNNEEGEENGAVRLVEILNEYLGALSDAIMDNKGTIDKYVGDEIVSFFGAPLDDEYNAFNACVAGIRMKQAEEIYNLQHYYTDHDIPAPLLSRVGLNSGYMVVGNMGTVKKLNYTIMGNNVNLASRLEGTNKAYNSWIMCSESTWNAADMGEKKGLLVSRCFDCVQVINVKKPVQLYNILGLKSELVPEQVEAAQIFNAGMKYYLNGRDTPDEPKDLAEIHKALNLFEQAKACFPDDRSSDTFIERCKDLIANGLPDKWDGVYVMKSK
ncbi:MAG: CHASE2 domain-containing protein [Treponema sp.]|nr:CHASE2 domain-containing protein [Treponema sp.]